MLLWFPCLSYKCWAVIETLNSLAKRAKKKLSDPRGLRKALAEAGVRADPAAAEAGVLRLGHAQELGDELALWRAVGAWGEGKQYYVGFYGSML